VSLAVGLAAAAAFAAASPLVVALGLAGYHLHVLLDYVDGEVARCRGETSVRGAYFDLITDRITYPLFVWAAALGAERATGDPTLLVAGFAAAFGLLLDKAAVDCWYRANAGAPELEDRYVAPPPPGRRRRWRSRVALALVMSRGLTAFLTYTALAAAADAAHLLGDGGARALVVRAFALVMPLGALLRFLWVYRRGAIPRRQQLL
jgi:phosphatidylglycerophosphate synthase